MAERNIITIATDDSTAGNLDSFWLNVLIRLNQQKIKGRKQDFITFLLNTGMAHYNEKKFIKSLNSNNTDGKEKIR